MDSRLKWQVIASVSTIFVLIIVLVLVLNQTTGAGKKSTSQKDIAVGVANITEGDIDYVTGGDASDIYAEYDLNPDRDPFAFLADGSFFDKSGPGTGTENGAESGEDKLSLLISSVQKDLRIYVVGADGLPVPGKSFFVSLRGAKDAKESAEVYKDLDQDGMIYIGDLKSGEYMVGLQPAAGYQSDTAETQVFVKNQVEYQVISDISFLMRTEDQIDPTVDDTGENGATKDADGTESTEQLSQKDAVLGIDVSKWNKEIDWNKVKADGVEFAIIRCGYRGSTTGYLVEDPYFRKNIEGARQAGVKVGVYFFTQAVTEVEAVEEASMVTMLCQEYALDYPVFIDTEGAGGKGRADSLSKEDRTKVCAAFCRTIENSGKKSGVYASKNWFEKNLSTEDISAENIWLAQYSSKATYAGDYQMWQYTSSGTVDGIEGRVDLNLSYKKY